MAYICMCVSVCVSVSVVLRSRNLSDTGLHVDRERRAEGCGSQGRYYGLVLSPESPDSPNLVDCRYRGHRCYPAALSQRCELVRVARGKYKIFCCFRDNFSSPERESCTLRANRSYHFVAYFTIRRLDFCFFCRSAAVFLFF